MGILDGSASSGGSVNTAQNAAFQMEVEYQIHIHEPMEQKLR